MKYETEWIVFCDTKNAVRGTQLLTYLGELLSSKSKTKFFSTPSARGHLKIYKEAHERKRMQNSVDNTSDSIQDMHTDVKGIKGEKSQPEFSSFLRP